MSLRTALQAIAILIVGAVLLWGLLAMGPFGWVVFGTMLLIGTIQVYRKRRSGVNTGDRGPRYCANCGSQIDVALFDAGHPDEMADAGDPDGMANAGDPDGITDAGGPNGSNWSIRYCPDCGAPVVPPSDTESEPAVVNCPDCGAPNDPTDSECAYCRVEL